MKLAEKQKKQQENKKFGKPEPEALKSEKQSLAPGKQSQQQVYCKDAPTATRFIGSKPDVLENSEPLESKNKIKYESETTITLGDQIKLG